MEFSIVFQQIIFLKTVHQPLSRTIITITMTAHGGIDCGDPLMRGTVTPTDLDALPHALLYHTHTSLSSHHRERG